MANNIEGILLFAGESKRMGKLKSLLPIGEETVVETVLNEYCASSLSEVVLVLGTKVLSADVVKYAGEVLSFEKFVYILMNKPKTSMIFG